MTALLKRPPARSHSRRRPLRASMEPDQLVTMWGIDWALYLKLDAKLEGSGTRLTYCDGRLDLMTLSNDHERIKNTLSHLISQHCMDEDLAYINEGSATRRLLKSHGKEPDDSFIFGDEPKRIPDMVIEIVLTSGGVDSLEFYAAFKIPEVLIWQNGLLNVFVSDGAKYRKVRKSRLLPKFDMGLAGELAMWPVTSKALKEYRKRTSR